MSRRLVLPARGLAALAAVLTLVAGFAVPVSAQPRSGGTLTVVQGAEPAALVSGVNTSTFIGTVSTKIHEGLLDYELATKEPKLLVMKGKADLFVVDLPEEVLSDLAGRVRLRTLPAGKPVIRQGDRAQAFYVVRRGTLQVVEEDPQSGDERVLRVLGRGESFGELGLTEAAPRTATVEAIEDSQLFEFDKGTFERLLADMVHVPEFAPTLEAVAELRALPAFAALEPDELFEVLEHGRWVNVAPGEPILERGGKRGGLDQSKVVRERRGTGGGDEGRDRRVRDPGHRRGDDPEKLGRRLGAEQLARLEEGRG